MRIAGKIRIYERQLIRTLIKKIYRHGARVPLLFVVCIYGLQRSRTCEFHRFRHQIGYLALRYYMSLHRVSSFASYEQVRRSSPARSKQGNLSFKPVESWIGPGPRSKPVTALEVSKSKRICTKIHSNRNKAIEDTDAVGSAGRCCCLLLLFLIRNCLWVCSD